MRIQLTETQFALAKRINEGVDISRKIIDGIKDVKDDADKLYSIITFTTVAEFRDGDADVGVLDQRVEQLADRTNKLSSKVYEFEQTNMDYDGNWYNPRLEQVYKDMDMAIYQLNPKITALENIISIIINYFSIITIRSISAIF